MINRALGLGPHRIWWGNLRTVKVRLRQAVGRALYSEFLQPMSQGVGMEIQDSRRTLGSFNNSPGLLESSKNVASFNVLQSGQWRCRPTGRQGFLSMRFKVFLFSPMYKSWHKVVVQQQSGTRRQDHRALNNIL